ncbi:hypothetical protein [Helicobacter pylori]|nr:hypothetical protein [Helicobacter pylori]
MLAFNQAFLFLSVFRGVNSIIWLLDNGFGFVFKVGVKGFNQSL